MLLVPGDCPSLDAGEVTALLAHTEPVVIVPDRHGQGTNALLLTPPDVMAPAFGEGSFARHAALAAAAGATLRVVDVPSLGLDIDTAEDLAALTPRPRHRSAHARAARAGGGRLIELTALPGLPEVRAGDDLAALLARRRGVELTRDDVLVVAHKVVSQGRGPDVAPAPTSPRARGRCELAARARQGPAPGRGRARPRPRSSSAPTTGG